MTFARVARAAILLGLVGLILATGCKNADDRERIRNQLGPPDRIETRGADPFWAEFWYYYDEGVAYEFRRTAPKCGGGRDVYLYAEYYGDFRPHEPGQGFPGGEGTILGP
ncbi:MAG: hypothetical protein GXO73_09180 [Calditrichaeota bacterium]|nr:hypothetical protein [Calditrichota bacterium]